LKKSGLQKEAIAELLAALEQARNNELAKVRIGGLLLEYGSPRQAADVFNDVLGSNSSDAHAWSGFGTAELALEDYRAARNAFRNAARLDPSDDQTRRNLELTDRILALDPNAGGLRASDRYERSVEILTAALKMQETCSRNDLTDAARKALAGRPRRREIEDAAEMDLDLAVKLWKSARNLCPSRKKDEALDQVLARLARQ
jgi:tetratricopeptide (TPR) repeat protein